MGGNFRAANPCGLICNECRFYLNEKDIFCPGCAEMKGKPFWGECKVFLCNQVQKTEHCGECKEFPCETIIDQYDPNIPRGEEEAIFRIGQLAIRAQIGTEIWLEKRSNGDLPKFSKD